MHGDAAICSQKIFSFTHLFSWNREKQHCQTSVSEEQSYLLLHLALTYRERELLRVQGHTSRECNVVFACLYFKFIYTHTHTHTYVYENLSIYIPCMCTHTTKHVSVYLLKKTTYACVYTFTNGLFTRKKRSP